MKPGQPAFQPRRTGGFFAGLGPRLLAAGAMACACAATASPPCKDIADDRQRLACYDALSNPVAPAAPAPAAAPVAVVPAPAPMAPSPAAAAAPAPAPPPAAAPVQPAAAPPAVPPAAVPAMAVAPATAPAAPVPQVFGAELLARPGDAAANADLIAHLVGSLDGIQRGTVFTLDNGQVWASIDDQQLYYEADNPGVVIHRNVVGNYWLTPEHAKFSIRVSRLK